MSWRVQISSTDEDTVPPGVSGKPPSWKQVFEVVFDNWYREALETTQFFLALRNDGVRGSNSNVALSLARTEHGRAVSWNILKAEDQSSYPPKYSYIGICCLQSFFPSKWLLGLEVPLNWWYPPVSWAEPTFLLSCHPHLGKEHPLFTCPGRCASVQALAGSHCEFFLCLSSWVPSSLLIHLLHWY